MKSTGQQLSKTQKEEERHEKKFEEMHQYITVVRDGV